MVKALLPLCLRASPVALPRRLAVLLGILLTPGLLAAQTVKGVVVEEGSRTPVRGATVELTPRQGGSPVRTDTDSLGAFRQHVGKPGVYLLRLTHISYAQVSDTVSVGKEETVQLELHVSQAAIPLQPLVVTARARDPYEGFYERSRRGGFGRFLTREEIERRSALRVTWLLEGMPGVQIVRVPLGSGMFTNLIATRGGALGHCFPMIYIDGMPMRQMAESGVDDYLLPQTLEGVEIYPSQAGVPAQFLTLDACGVVAFWTRKPPPGRWSWWRFGAGVGGFLLLVLLTRS
jgi:hypothetical protein